MRPLLLLALVVGCSSEPPKTISQLQAERAAAQESMDFYLGEAEALQVQLDNGAKTIHFRPDGLESKAVDRHTAEGALAEAEKWANFNRLKIDRITREIEQAEAADLTAGE